MGESALAEPFETGGSSGARSPRLVGAGAVTAVLLLFGFLLLRPAPAGGAENGAFTADCCGTLRLEDGRMLLNGKQSVRYTVGRDGQGPYVLPVTYVGAFEDLGFEVDGTRPTVKLRLDRLPAPGGITLYHGTKPMVFRREANSLPLKSR
jgi:hypothetical protein